MKREISSCPEAGGGVHRWIMETAWTLRLEGTRPEEARRILASSMTRRPSPANEIDTAVAKVFGIALSQRESWTPFPSAPKWPAPNLEQIEAITASGYGVVDLWEASPARVKKQVASEVLPTLFPGDPMLCVGNRSLFVTDHLSAFIDRAHTLEQIVPSPMKAKFGRTQAGKLSQHTLEATGPRRFLVFEADMIQGSAMSKDHQAAILLELAKVGPLSLVCDSGGKSLHGWFFCAGLTDEALTPFFRVCCTLGADPAMWTRSQFARMPGGTRDNGNRQPIYFFNSETIKP